MYPEYLAPELLSTKLFRFGMWLKWERFECFNSRNSQYNVSMLHYRDFWEYTIQHNLEFEFQLLFLGYAEYNARKKGKILLVSEEHKSSVSLKINFLTTLSVVVFVRSTVYIGIKDGNELLQTMIFVSNYCVTWFN